MVQQTWQKLTAPDGRPFHVPVHGMVKLTSKENELFEIPADVLDKLSSAFAVAQDGGETSGYSDAPFHLPKVTSAVMTKLIEWCEYYKDKEEVKYDKHTDIAGWDHDFLPTEHDAAVELLHGAYVLEIKSLVDICCKRVADIMKGTVGPRNSRRTQQKNKKNKGQKANEGTSK